MRTAVAVRLAGVALVLLVASCRTAPILTPEISFSTLSTEQPLTAAKVADAIKLAGLSRGWEIQDAGQGHLTGTLRLRSHLAVVDIAYTAESVRIAYKDSTNLRYGDGKIHRNYNRWVNNLAESIRQQLGDGA